MNKNKLGEGGRNEKGIQGEETAYANVLRSIISKELRKAVYVWIVRSEGRKAVKADKAGEELVAWPGHSRPCRSSSIIFIFFLNRVKYHD